MSILQVLSALAVVGILPAVAQNSTTSSPLSEYTLTADNITAKFIPYGARLTSLVVPDRDGSDQDVVLGYDDTSQYVTDTETNHTYFGPVVGRFANRIVRRLSNGEQYCGLTVSQKNGTFTLNGQSYNIPTNENKGADTLHGGSVGYDQRNWTVTSQTDTSITFTLLDQGFEGLPGTLLTHQTFTVGTSPPTGATGETYPRLTSSITAVALDQTTPVMMANHIYWNLNGFSAPTILNDTTLWMPYSDRYIQVDPILIPNGTFGTVASLPTLDFTSPKLIGRDISDAVGVCGAGCTGYDNAFIVDRPVSARPSAVLPILSLWSQNTGIKMDLSTNQQGLQIYSCNGQNGTIPVKQSQQQRNQGVQGATDVVNKYGCLVIETQGVCNSNFF